MEVLETNQKKKDKVLQYLVLMKMFPKGNFICLGL